MIPQHDNGKKLGRGHFLFSLSPHHLMSLSQRQEKQDNTEGKMYVWMLKGHYVALEEKFKLSNIYFLHNWINKLFSEMSPEH